MVVLLIAQIIIQAYLHSLKYGIKRIYTMSLRLSDGQRYDEFSKYYDFIKDKKNSELKDKATNIDF